MVFWRNWIIQVIQRKKMIFRLVLFQGNLKIEWAGDDFAPAELQSWEWNFDETQCI
jgi:hypothetical protein